MKGRGALSDLANDHWLSFLSHRKETNSVLVTFASLAELKGSEREHRLQAQEVYFFSTWEEEVTEFRALG